MTARLRNIDKRIRILAINDVYDLTNLPKLLNLKKRLRPSPDAFVVAGDFLSPSVLSSIDQGQGIVDMFNAIGVTHVCFGNHEADLSLDVITQRMKESQFQWVNTNIPSFPRSNQTVNSAIISSKCGSVSLCMLGMMSDEPDMFRDGCFKGLEIESTLKHVKESHESLSVESSQVLITLTHQSLRADKKLAKKCSKADISLPLIIGGHDHIPIIERHAKTDSCPLGTLIVKTGSDAMNAAVIDLNFHAPTSSSSSSSSYTLSHIDVSLLDVTQYQSDLPSKARAERHISVLANLEDYPMINTSSVGTLLASAGTSTLSSEGTRFKQTTMGALLAHAVKEELNTDVCVINGAPIKGDRAYYDGSVTLQQLMEELPFPTKMISVNMPGKVLQDSIRYSRTEGKDGQERRGFLQVDPGVDILGQWEPEAGVDPVIVSVNGVPFSEDKTYNVALPRNTLNGFCSIEPLVSWAKEEKLKTIAAKTIIDPEHMDDHLRESGWSRYSKNVNLSKAEESLRLEDGRSKQVTHGDGQGNKPSNQLNKPSEYHVQQVMADLLKQSNDTSDTGRHVVEATRSIPSEDAFIPCINLVLAHYTKAQWRELASSFSFDELDRDKSGSVDRHEIALAYAKKYNTPLSPALLEMMMKTLDADGNDEIDRAEYDSIGDFEK